ncbi:hypothetical protein PJ985_04160 [Streptomyces sp. ACA25]|uniref:hypothetical protein n=1 Tax=Streptomyces sp. ACA25 TaxID=3022596 RepID=UPI002306F4F1|nr:hypothetical protein [Streptomyces sp. ACA25]MDB1086759.1 hypothetical protein [Streptomyces sp. ACA25]
MTRLTFTDTAEAAGLAAFLERHLRWDKKAAVRLRASGGVLAVFARPARFEVLAVLTGRLSEPEGTELDATVSAGELLEGIDEQNTSAAVPGPVTGPPWSGLLPPRGGWQPRAELPGADVRAAAAAVVAEFRRRTEQLAAEERTRTALDALAEEIWSRTLADTGLPLRAVHAAHALGFLRSDAPVTVLSAGSWLRLRTPRGSIAVRRGGPAPLTVTPLSP